MLNIKKPPIENPSKECIERNYLLQLEFIIAEKKHKLKMDQLAYERENSRLFHEQNLERGRINRAEDRKIRGIQ